MSNIFYKSVGLGIADGDDGDRNGRRELLYCARRCCSQGDDDIGIKAHQFPRVGADMSGITAAEVQVDPQVAPFDPAELREPIPDYGDKGPSSRIVLAGG